MYIKIVGEIRFCHFKFYQSNIKIQTNEKKNTHVMPCTLWDFVGKFCIVNSPFRIFSVFISNQSLYSIPLRILKKEVEVGLSMAQSIQCVRINNHLRFASQYTIGDGKLKYFQRRGGVLSSSSIWCVCIHQFHRLTLIAFQMTLNGSIDFKYLYYSIYLCID